METMFEALERKKSLLHASEKPWSDYTQADYTPEQWHRACLIHLHDGAPTSKDQCKLPVRTPGGAVSRPGVHAAAAALAGARGGVDASDAQKSSAAKALITLYKSLSETPPDSLVQHSELAHYGTKGMKWGVRQDRGHVGERAKTRKISRLDKNYETRIYTGDTYVKIHNRAAELTNNHDIARINNKPEYRNADFRQDSPLRQKYYQEHQKAFTDNVMRAAKEFGTNASGTKKIGVELDDVGDWAIYLGDVKHAAGDDFLNSLVGLTIKVHYDSQGHIVRIEIPSEKDVVQQTDMNSAFNVSDFLEHYGVKGMKWGQTKIREPHSEDATRVRDIHSRVGSHKSTSILSNKELEIAIKRMDLEQRYSKLSGGHDQTRRKKIATWFSETLLGIAKDTAKEVGKSEASLQVKDVLDQKMERGKYAPKPGK